ncbi:putative outer membrane starch-binding protein [Chitinophaga niastensis]|uniref:Putative outer membrane starch-binding protein n=1 Tax=Chitinophaga niastensis TaxID=536980 RepID=A0A2P8HDS3_CHINA|nr:RagB/SusD family nutrient uptake outer membrane protein [Chitinophaga niastensis]PSL44380.1 putative outer membrane starch-binding protein [Chitinophaga niastensis]
MRNRFSFIILLTITCSVLSCKKTLTTDVTSLVPEANMWQVKNDARSAVFATYGLLRAALANSNAFMAYGELRGGDFRISSRQDLNAVLSNNLNANYSALEEWKDWQRFYAVIAQANLCIEKLQLVSKNDFRYRPEDLKLDIANIRYLRALTYFYLARIWGDVPLITTNAAGYFKGLPATPQATVLAFAANEAAAAVTDLPWRYDGTWPEQQGNYWNQNDDYWHSTVGTKASCYALLAHIAAWQQDYAMTEKYCRLVMDNSGNGGYTVATTSQLTAEDGVFKGKGLDVIFSLSFSADYQEASVSGHVEDWTLSEPFVPKKTADIYVPKDSVLAIFDEAGDERFSLNQDGTSSGNFFTNFNNSAPMFSKIKVRAITQAPVLRSYESAIIIFRYEEIILLRAAAAIRINDVSHAQDYLNMIRSQRGLGNLASKDGNEILSYILKERRRELLGEGWRWFDLVQFKQVAAYTTLSQTDVDNGATLWPVSKSALANNPTLIQNNFWKK